MYKQTCNAYFRPLKSHDFAMRLAVFSSTHGLTTKQANLTINRGTS